jgi:hypothetical protein
MRLAAVISSILLGASSYAPCETQAAMVRINRATCITGLCIPRTVLGIERSSRIRSRGEPWRSDRGVDPSIGGGVLAAQLRRARRSVSSPPRRRLRRQGRRPGRRIAGATLT